MSNEDKRNLRNAIRAELLARARYNEENPLPVNDTNGRHDRSRQDVLLVGRLFAAGGSPRDLSRTD